MGKLAKIFIGLLIIGGVMTGMFTFMTSLMNNYDVPLSDGYNESYANITSSIDNIYDISRDYQQRLENLQQEPSLLEGALLIPETISMIIQIPISVVATALTLLTVGFSTIGFGDWIVTLIIAGIVVTLSLMILSTLMRKDI